MFPRVSVLSGHFAATLAELSSCDRDRDKPLKPKIFTIGPFTKEIC